MRETPSSITTAEDDHQRHQLARELAHACGIDLAADMDRERQRIEREALVRALEDRLGADEARHHLGDGDTAADPHPGGIAP